MKKSSVLMKIQPFLLFVLLLLTVLSCEKEEPRPAIGWLVEYAVSTVGSVTVESITYIDQFGQEQTIPGDNNFRLTFEAESGYVGNLEVRATAAGGGIFANIEATALDGTLRRIANSDNDGQASTTPKNILLQVSLILP